MGRYSRHVSTVEKIVAVILWLMAVAAVVTQLFFNENVLALAAVSAVCGVVFSCLVFLPETYELQENALVVESALRKRLVIPYEQILHIDTVGTFRGSKRDFDTVEVMVKYRPTGKKLTRTVSCHPKNVLGFVNTLKPSCPNLIWEAD